MNTSAWCAKKLIAILVDCFFPCYTVFILVLEGFYAAKTTSFAEHFTIV